MGIRVLLVDDNALFREGIEQILRADGRFDVVGHASSGEEGAALAQTLQPDLVLMDLQMPGMGGIAAIRFIRERQPSLPIGVLTMLESSSSVEAALAAGATGYVAKDATPAEFCAAAEAVARGARELVAVPGESGPTLNSGASRRLANLTAQQRRVLQALASGASNEAIAEDLGISVKTLRNHISSTYHKLGIYDRTQAVMVAVHEGLVDVPPR